MNLLLYSYILLPKDIKIYNVYDMNDQYRQLRNQWQSQLKAEIALETHIWSISYMENLVCRLQKATTDQDMEYLGRIIPGVLKTSSNQLKPIILRTDAESSDSDEDY